MSSPLKRILSRLPSQIHPQRFAQDILGFEDYAQNNEQPADEGEEEYEPTNITVSQA